LLARRSVSSQALSGSGTDEADLVLAQPGGVPFFAPVRTTVGPASARAAVAPFADAPDEDAVALCLSGGGWRALAFHAGAVAALGRTGRLAQVTHVTGVSAGAP
jgi:predicted acylesterase/phospholipase RssA